MDRCKVVMLSADSLGKGDEALGKMLMANFLRLLGEGGRHPEVICLLNSGVRLATDGNLCIAHMKRLSELGTMILICRTCLEFFGLEDQVATGKVSTMHEIQAYLLMGDTLSL